MNRGMCTCDQCGSEIKIVPSMRKEGDLEITSFRCQTCMKEYTIIITDSKLRSMMQRTEKLRLKAMRNRMTVPRFERLMKEYKVSLKESEEYKKKANLHE